MSAQEKQQCECTRRHPSTTVSSTVSVTGSSAYLLRATAVPIPGDKENKIWPAAPTHKSFVNSLSILGFR